MAIFWSLWAGLSTAGAIMIAYLVLRMCSAPSWVPPSAVPVLETWSTKYGLESGTVDVTQSQIPLPGLLAVAYADRELWWGPVVLRVTAQFPALRSTSAALGLLVLVWGIFWWGARSAQVRAEAACLRLGFEVASRLRSGLHRQVLRMGPGDLTGEVAKQALELFANDTDEVRNAVQKWADSRIRMPVWLVILTLLGFTLQPGVFFYIAVPLGLCWLFLQSQTRLVRHRKALSHVDSERELRLLAERLTRARLTKGYGMENAEREQFDKTLLRYQTEAAKIVQPLGVSGWSLRIGTWVCGIVVAYLVGVKLISDPNQLSLAGVAVLVACFSGISLALEQIQSAIRIRQSAIPAAMRIQRFLDRIPDVSQAVGAKFLEPLSKAIEFYQVNYALPGQPPLLDLLSLSIPAGKEVAVIATDERAAQALVSLLPRFIDPQGGQVLFDGEDIAWVTLESLRSEAVCVCSGHEAVFTGTVLENIVAGLDNQALADVTQAAKTSHAHHFIQKLPQGYETVIGEHGETLDAGQSLRLGLARALLRDPALLVIEEPAETLDENTKSMLDDAYGRIATKRTVIYLPHRLTTLRRCDEIILLHQGQVAARGTHTELVRTSELYRHWEYVHFNVFRHEEPHG